MRLDGKISSKHQVWSNTKIPAPFSHLISVHATSCAIQESSPVSADHRGVALRTWRAIDQCRGRRRINILPRREGERQPCILVGPAIHGADRPMSIITLVPGPFVTVLQIAVSSCSYFSIRGRPRIDFSTEVSRQNAFFVSSHCSDNLLGVVGKCHQHLVEQRRWLWIWKPTRGLPPAQKGRSRWFVNCPPQKTRFILTSVLQFGSSHPPLSRAVREDGPSLPPRVT